MRRGGSRLLHCGSAAVVSRPVGVAGENRRVLACTLPLGRPDASSIEACPASGGAANRASSPASGRRLVGNVLGARRTARSLLNDSACGLALVPTGPVAPKTPRRLARERGPASETALDFSVGTEPVVARPRMQRVRTHVDSCLRELATPPDT